MDIGSVSASPVKMQTQAKPVDKTDELLQVAMDGKMKANEKMLKANYIDRGLNIEPHKGNTIDIKA